MNKKQRYKKCITDNPKQRFMRFVIKGNAIPLLNVSPEPVRYIGTLQAGKKYEYKYELVPTNPKENIFLDGAWWKRTANGAPSQFTPGTTHENVKGLISEAFKAAAKQGKIKPQDLDGFVFDTGRIIGASNGKKVTKIKIHINADGKCLHAFPFN